MRNVLTLVKNNLRILIVKKPGYTLMMVLLPLIIFLIIPKIMSGSTGAIKVGVVDEGNTFSSNRIIKFISSDEMMEIIKVDNEEELNKKFSNKDVDLGVVIKKDYEKQIFEGDRSGIIIKGLENENLYITLSEGIGLETSNLMNLAKINNFDYEKYKDSVNNKETNAIKIEKKDLKDVRGDFNSSQALIGFVIIFAFYRSMSGSGLIGEDKEQHMYTRILVSSVKPWQYYLSNIISTVILLIILFALSIIEINIVTDINLGISNLQLLIILILVSIVAVSIGTFCTTVTDDRDLSSIISNFMTITFLALGGCFVPIRYLSPTINKISYLTPTRWAMDAISNIQEGAAMKVVVMNLLILTLFAIVFFVASVYCINRRDRVDRIS